MDTLSDKLRFWLPLIFLAAFGIYTSYSLIRAHVDAEVQGLTYDFERELKAPRGGIYDVNGDPLALSVPIWEYHLDPVDLTNRVVRPSRKEAPRTRKQIVTTIANALNVEPSRIAAMAENSKKRYQPLGVSTDIDAHAILADSRYVSGVIINDSQVRQYPGRRSLCHVLGAVNFDFDGVAGV